MSKHIQSTHNRNFLAAATHVIPIVSTFGEYLIACLTGGQVVSHTEEFCEVADVFVWETFTSFQVKMCNFKHAQRPTAKQIDRLYQETHSQHKPFVAEIHSGLYAFVFYHGIKFTGNKGTSKLLSRKNNKEAKFEIIANEIQYIYLVEVDLLHHFLNSEEFADIKRSGGCKVHAERKIEHYKDRLVLYLTRSFFSGFLGKIPQKLRSALDESFGHSQWCIEKHLVEFEFNNSIRFKRSIPICFIGRKKTHEIIGIKSQVRFNLNDIT